eukprot:8376906-Pyramimonas_sp.AAC.1
MEAYRTRGRRVGDFGVMKVSYYSKHGIPGRWYAAGPSTQSHLSRDAKKMPRRLKSGRRLEAT